MGDKFKCVVSSDLFRRALMAVSTEQFRSYLNGVFIEPCAAGGATLTATNGHFLLCFHDPRAIIEGSGIVQLDARMKRELASKKADFTGRQSGEPERVVGVLFERGVSEVAFVAMSSHPYKLKKEAGEYEDVEPRSSIPDLFDKMDSRVLAVQFSGTVIDGTYPDWRGAVPEYFDPNVPVGVFSADYIGIVSEALNGPSKMHTGLRLTGKTNGSLLDPVLARGSNQIDGAECFGILMPFGTVDGYATTLPDFIKSSANQPDPETMI